MKRELHKSKYDKYGRPIKKSLFSFFQSNDNSQKNKYEHLDNSYASKRFIKEDTKVENFKSKLSKKFDNIEKKFKKENKTYTKVKVIGYPENKDFFFYNLALLFGFFIMGFGLVIGIYILIKSSNKMNSTNFKFYKRIRITSIGVIAYQLFIITLFIFAMSL